MIRNKYLFVIVYCLTYTIYGASFCGLGPLIPFYSYAANKP